MNAERVHQLANARCVYDRDEGRRAFDARNGTLTTGRPDRRTVAERSHGRPAIACLSNLDWGFLRYRKQHLMERLSQRADVIYVDPPRAVKSREWPFRRRTSHVAPNLWVHQPFVMPGMRDSAVARQITYRWLASRLGRWRRGGPFVLWLYSPHGLPFVDLLRPDFVVYDIADLHATHSGPRVRDDIEHREIMRLAELETSLLSVADLVLCVSEPLVEWVGTRASRVRLVPNGCDWPRYAGMRPGKVSSAAPRIGYVGSLAPRLDVNLVADVAKARPGWHIELVGPVSPLVDLAPLRSLPNVVLAGAVPYEDVPARIASFDVCLLPLLEIDFAYFCSPIQVFDYLAAGKPVVSTPVGQLERWPELVHSARGPTEFVAAIEQALGERSNDVFLRRRAFAERNSWDARVEDIVNLLGEMGLGECAAPLTQEWSAS